MDYSKEPVHGLQDELLLEQLNLVSLSRLFVLNDRRPGSSSRELSKKDLSARAGGHVQNIVLIATELSKKNAPYELASFGHFHSSIQQILENKFRAANLPALNKVARIEKNLAPKRREPPRGGRRR